MTLYSTSTDTAPFTLKTGDLARPIKYQLVDGTGAAVDLTGATSVTFKMVQKTATSPKTVTGTATVVNAATGIVQYQPVTNDTTVSGDYSGEFTVTWPTNLPDTFPSDGYLDIKIYPHL